MADMATYVLFMVHTDTDTDTDDDNDDDDDDDDDTLIFYYLLVGQIVGPLCRPYERRT